MEFAAVAGNLARVREEIARIQASEGQDTRVRIVAVTKGQPGAAVLAALHAGVTDIGENRVQEALEKQAALPEVAVRWHLIGHLQTNKAKFVPGNFSMVHSVDALKVAEALAKAQRQLHGATGGADEVDRLAVLLQVNVAGEAQKSGCSLADAPELAHRIQEMPGLSLEGLMTMAPFTDDDAVQRKTFCTLRLLRDRLEAAGLRLPELSMGMSGDYKAAVAEGATLVRLGTVLFGERQ